jgi:hypothetical protein
MAKKFTKLTLGDVIPTPATAEVGQTIVVKTVDENGKPTEWEAAYGGARLVIDYTTEEETLNETIKNIDFTTDLTGKPLAIKNCLIKICGTVINNVDSDSTLRIGFSNKDSSVWNGFYCKPLNQPIALFIFASIDEQSRISILSQLSSANVSTSIVDASQSVNTTVIDKISISGNNYNKTHLAAGARIQVWEVL